jgi:acetyltransferase-like isoleucine patch superfamily enzyme
VQKVLTLRLQDKSILFMSYLGIIFNPAKMFFVSASLIIKWGHKGRCILLKAKHKLPTSVSMGEVRIIGKNLEVGAHTYFNSGHIATAPDAKVSIGKWCAIGHNVTILAITHDTGISTGPEHLRPSRKGDVLIEDGVWIGSNVIITPGVHVGKMCVIGGNSVVTKDLPPYTICAGIPCKVLRKKEDEEIRKHEEIIK